MSNEVYNGRKILFNQEANPCGKICVPLNKEYCFLTNSNEPLIDTCNELITSSKDVVTTMVLAQTACRMLVEVQNATIDLDESLETANFWKTVAENLTRDDLTGLLTGKGLEAILDELYSVESVKTLEEKNYYARIIYADINDLKMHNSGPGGHRQGDMAIATIGQAISKYVNSGRRQRNHTYNSSDRRRSLQIPRTIAARSNEKGDEFFIMSLLTKPNVKSFEETKLTLDKLFSDLSYTYNDTTYAVSATYGISQVKFPKSREELREVIAKIDTAMMQHKNIAKTTGQSMGTVIKL